jgi:hypothetical protein
MAKEIAENTQKDPMWYVENKSRIMDYLKWETGGDTAKAKSWYENGAGALNRMAPTDALRANLVSVFTQAGTTPQPPVAQSMAGGAAPTATPTPTPAQATTPAAQGQAASPAPAPGGMVTLAHPLPENVNELAQLSGTLAANKPLMDAFRASLIAQKVQGVGATGTPEKNVALLRNSANSFMQFVNSLPDDKKLALVNGGGAPSDTAGVKDNFSTVQEMMTKGVPPAVQEGVTASLAKISAAINGDLEQEVTGKDVASMKRAVSSFKVDTESPEYKEFIAAGLNPAVLDKAAKQLNDLAQNDPDFISRLNSARALGDDYKGYVAIAGQDLKGQDVATRQGALADRVKRTTYTAAIGVARVQDQLQSMNQRFSMNQNSEEYKLSGRAMQSWQQLEQVQDSYRQKFIDTQKALGKDPSATDIQNYMMDTLKDKNSQLYAAMTWASLWTGKALNMSPQDATGYTVASSILGVQLPWGRQAEGITYPSPGATAAAASGSKPAPSANSNQNINPNPSPPNETPDQRATRLNAEARKRAQAGVQ